MGCSPQVDTDGLIAIGPRHVQAVIVTAELDAQHASLRDTLIDPATSLETSAVVEMYDACEEADYQAVRALSRDAQGNL